MKKSIFTMVLSLFLIFLTIEGNAQQNFIVSLRMPPQGTLNVSDFWNITVTNNSGSEQSGYLVGTAKEDKDGMIAKGTTVPIMFKKGINNIKIKDLPKTPDVEYIAKDPRYKESLIRQGKFPSGKYEICVKVISAGTNEELGSDCINQEVLETGLLTLINPADGEEIDTKVPITFSWSSGGNIPEDGYTLRIVEVLKNQTPEIAMKGNKAWFEQKGIKTTTFRYPKSAKGFEEEKTYTWMVNKSEVITFKILTGGKGILSTNGIITLTPTSQGCCDSVYINLNGNLYNFFSITSGGANTNTIESAVPVNSTINPSNITSPVSSVTWHSLGSSFIQSPYSLGSICFTNKSTPFTMVVQFSTNGGATFEGEQTIQINCPIMPPPSLNDNKINPCCPPWNKDMLLEMMDFDFSGGISDPYTVHFNPTQTFIDQMQNYLNYLYQLNHSITAINIAWRLHDHGTNAIPNVSGPQIDPTWTSVSWTQGPIGTSLTYFNQYFFTGFPMIAGTWYKVHTGIYLNDDIKFFPEECSVSDIFVRIQAVSTSDPNIRSLDSPVLEFSFDGITIDKTIPIKKEVK